jgi:hypothetical protein
MSEEAMDMRIDRIATRLQALAQSLTRLGYRFERPKDVLPGVERGTDAAIARIEREVGALPLALTLFWKRIGSVDLSGQHPDWQDCEYPDPLIVYPPSVAIDEWDEVLADREEFERFGNRYVIPVAPDAYHKANVSGGMYYNISVPAASDDPPLNDEPHETTFLCYLELAIGFGGFPGLEGSPGHTWPLDRIIRG